MLMCSTICSVADAGDDATVTDDESDEEDDGEGDVVVRVNPVLKMTDYLTTTYPVTKDEIKRRMAEPEKYSITNITSYMRLRRGTDVKVLIRNKGVNVDQKNRCQMVQSPYLRLTEGECSDLATGIMEVDSEFFPIKETSKEVASYTPPTGPLADHMGPAEDRRNLIVKAR